MARQTRQQRRARRAQQQPALAGGSPPPPPVRPVESGDARPEPRKPKREGEERHAPGSGTVRFIRESWGELQKVEWPSQKGVVSGTAVVLIACIIVGTYLYLNDMLWKYVVQHILLK
ncbi:MAG TPA: preprotein translocase subunit SecE [Thermoanaerobaculia bacterium]|jgi:preprotein translocase SecE subunit|nr:preprotein translocase subunit SecE [Thermoanaerobaculia bacterium]